MKTTIKLILFLLFAGSLAIYSCDGDVATKQSKSYPEELSVKHSDFSVFYNDLIAFKNQLNASQKQLLDNYVNSLPSNPDKSKEGKVSAQCTCLENQSTCTASGTFNDCCVC